jgi:D-alanine-D-alanine ligase
MRVVVLGGGRSSEHEVALRSAASVREGLTAAGHEVVAVEAAKDGRWLGPDGAALAVVPGGGLLDADVVFPVLHGPFGEDGTVQGLLELLDVPYVGSGVLASAACMDKIVAKDLCGALGVDQVDYLSVFAEEWRAWTDERRTAFGGAVAARLGLPVFVKPSRLGSSVGIVKVDEAEELAAAIETALSYDPRVIVEAAAAGLEIECSVLGHTDAPETSLPGEIVIDAEWYDYEAKYTPGGMRLEFPARISDTARDRVRELAARAFTVLGCSGLARADFFVAGETVLLNELNTMPGFTTTSVYGKLWESSGLPYPELVDRLVTIAVERQARERAYTF